MYADDTQILVDLHPEGGEGDNLAPCRILLHEWMRQNLLCLNNDKTELLLVEGKGGLADSIIPWPPSWSPMPQPVTRTRNLGIFISPKLDGSAQAAASVQSCNHQINTLIKLCPLLTFRQKVKVYQALIGSQLNYGLIFLLGAPKKHIYSLQKAQNRAIRQICSLKWRDRISPWQSALKWLSVEAMITYKICIWLWKAFHKQGPGYLNKMVKHPMTNRSRRRMCGSRLMPNRAKKHTKGGRSITYAGVLGWNSLPLHIHVSNSLVELKKLLKAHLLTLEFSPMDDTNSLATIKQSSLALQSTIPSVSQGSSNVAFRFTLLPPAQTPVTGFKPTTVISHLTQKMGQATS